MHQRVIPKLESSQGASHCQFAISACSNSDRHTATEIDFEAGSSLNQGLGEVLSCKLPVTILKSDLPSMSEFKFV